MAINFGSLRRLVLGVTVDMMDKLWVAHDIPNSPTREELRKTSSALIDGYNSAVELGLSSELSDRLHQQAQDVRGTAYSGAGMGLILLDFLSPGKSTRFQSFIDAHPTYVSLIHVGAGIAMWVLKKDVEQHLSSFSPLNRWWAIDGFGFFDGISNWPQSLEKQQVPKRLQGYAKRAFDQGLGRGIWSIYHTNIDRIAACINQFPSSRHADLWSGIGLASTYVGGPQKIDLIRLRDISKEYAPDVALGSAMAASGRYAEDNITKHTDLACSIFCGQSAADIGQLSRDLLENLSVDEHEPINIDVPIYEIHRQCIREQLQQIPVIVEMFT